jgi:hypothetical protein
MQRLRAEIASDLQIFASSYRTARTATPGTETAAHARSAV